MKIPQIKKKTWLILLGLLLIIGFSSYYYWRGTPQYSILQLKTAVKNHDVDTALKYIDIDQVFDNLWERIKTEMLTESTETDNSFEALGAVLGIGLADSIKPIIKTAMRDGIINSIKEEENTSTTTDKLSDAWNKDYKIKKKDNKVYLEFDDGITFILIQTSKRYWKIIDIEGLLEDGQLQNVGMEPKNNQNNNEGLIKKNSQQTTITQQDNEQEHEEDFVLVEKI